MVQARRGTWVSAILDLSRQTAGWPTQLAHAEDGRIIERALAQRDGYLPHSIAEDSGHHLGGCPTKNRPSQLAYSAN